MNLSMVHIISLILTLVVTILPGIIAARKIKSADDYNVGGRSASARMVAGSIIGTIVGGAATVGTAQLGYKLGLTAWWFTLGSGIALIIMAIFYAVPLRRSSLTTVSEFLVGNYGKIAGPFTSISASAGIFFSIVASTLTALSLVAGLFKVNMETSGVIVLLLTVAIVFFGGISGAGMAGLLKILLIFSTIFVGGIISYFDMGQWQGLQAAFPAYPWFSLFGRGVEDGLFSLVSMIVGKAVNMCKMMDINIIGLIENMSYMECPTCSEKLYPFGRSKLEDLSIEYTIKGLCQMPINPMINELIDLGAVEEVPVDYLEYALNELINM